MSTQEPSRRSRSRSDAGDETSNAGITFDDDTIDTADYGDDCRDSEHPTSCSRPSEVLTSGSCVVLDSIPTTPEASAKAFVIKDTFKKHATPKEIKGKASGHTKCKEAHTHAMDRGDRAVEVSVRQNEYLNEYRVALLDYASETQTFMSKQQCDMKKQAEKVVRLTTQLTVANRAHQSVSANLKATIRELKGQLKTKRGVKNDELEKQIIDLMADAKGAKKEGERILTEKLRAQRVELGRVGKEAVDKLNNHLSLAKRDTSLEKVLVKDREKEIERLRKEKGDLEKKHEKAIEHERKSSADLMTKLQVKHDKQLEKQLNDAYTKSERKVDTERAINAKLVKENNDLKTAVVTAKTAAVTATKSRSGNKRGLSTTIEEMEHKSMNRLMEYQTKLNMNEMAANHKEIKATKSRSNSMIQMAPFLQSIGGPSNMGGLDVPGGLASVELISGVKIHYNGVVLNL